MSKLRHCEPIYSKSYAAYRMATLPVLFSDIEGQFCCLKPFCFTNLGKYSVYYVRYVYTSIGMRTWLVISATCSKTNERMTSQGHSQSRTL